MIDKTKPCKEKLVKRKPGEAKLFEVNDQRFFDNPLNPCGPKMDKLF